MTRIDAHQHFWKFDPVRDSWITEEMSLIQNDFSPDDLWPHLERNGFEGCVAVQASQSQAETDYLISLARQHRFIKAVVGWVDLQADDITDRLAQYKPFNIVKGFRHVLQGEPQRDLMLAPAFKRGISALQAFNFTYDILIFEDQLPFIPSFVSAFPDQPFAIDHLAKPNIKAGEIEQWKKGIVAAAQFENLFCKISGMVTEAAWNAWRKEDFRPYLDVVVEAFGTDRIMFGSDWPVCLVAASYDDVAGLVTDYFSSFTNDEQDKFFGENASRFYQL